MSEKEINIKSSTIEKGLELAKEFLGKLISPTIEEIGLLMSDNIRFLRFKNQVKILLKAKAYVEQHNISVKEVPIKILVPLLEKASLEEDETLQDKWANMLTNMADSESNLQNQIFPYLLSQISIEEYNALKEMLDKEIAFIAKCKDYDRLVSEEKEKKEKEKIKLIHSPYVSSHNNIKEEIDSIEQEGFILFLQEFEISNLQRLGLIRQMPPRVFIKGFKTGGQDLTFSGIIPEQWHDIEAKYERDNNGYRISELGERFLTICEANHK